MSRSYGGGFKDPKLRKKLRNAKNWFREQKDCKDPAFEETRRVCKDLKRRFRQSSFEEKIKRLREIAEIKIDCKQSYKRRMSRKHGGEGKRCWVCVDRLATCQHHIILLRNGGFDNGVNRIPICNECHANIHDWLKTSSGLKQWEQEAYQNAIDKD
mgnify:CR=1 FL=1